MKRRSSCRICGRYDTVAGRISRRGLCSACAEANFAANIRTLQQKSGAAYEAWVQRTMAGQARYLAKSEARKALEWQALDQARRQDQP